MKPKDIHEKIYLIVRNIRNRNKPQEYSLKKGDIIKLGRAKFKVKAMMIRATDRELTKKRAIMKTREEQWHIKQFKKEVDEQDKELFKDVCYASQF